MAITVRILTGDDWAMWRDLRLRALAESPDAFRPTLSLVEGESDSYWREMVGPTAEHERFNLWIALDGDVPMGTLFARIDEDFTTVHIGAMWVAPENRGAGVGGQLADAALDWGKGHGTTRAELWVTEANEATVRFYESRGFRPTADTQFLREGSDLVVRKLSMDF